MPLLLDLLYAVALAALSPWLLYQAATKGKHRRGFAAKYLGRPGPLPALAPGKTVWFHGVSVGEVHLLRQVVAGFRQRRPGWSCVVSTTTDTGFDEARRCFPDLPVIYWPFDFSWAVRGALRRVMPALVVLAEGELWPNFLRAARAAHVPVAVVNGRMSPRSGRRYRFFRFLTRPVLRRVSVFAVQTDEYAAAFEDAGAPRDRVYVTSNVKFDGVDGERRNPKTQQLGDLLAVRPGDRIWVAGSTQAPEEAFVLKIYARLAPRWPGLRLFLVPRQRDRFDEVAALLDRSGLPWVRRSELTATVPDRSAVVLVDTLGELGALWGLADLAFVGGSLDGRRGGQNMIEPAAYGAAVVFGPHVWNFRDAARRLLACGGALQVADEAALGSAIERLVWDEAARRNLGTAARKFVRQQQGATTLTLDLLDRLVHAEPLRASA